jgi:hypothetical protein
MHTTHGSGVVESAFVVNVRGYFRTRNGVEHWVRAHNRRRPRRRKRGLLVH